MQGGPSCLSGGREAEARTSIVHVLCSSSSVERHMLLQLRYSGWVAVNLCQAALCMENENHTCLCSHDEALCFCLQTLIFLFHLTYFGLDGLQLLHTKTK